jgi:hypothetical protein
MAKRFLRAAARISAILHEWLVVYDSECFRRRFSYPTKPFSIALAMLNVFS